MIEQPDIPTPAQVLAHELRASPRTAPESSGAGAGSGSSDLSPWIDASKWLPQGPHEVLATDGEGWFIASLQGSEWWLHELDEPCDSQVLYWMELPEIPEV